MNSARLQEHAARKANVEPELVSMLHEFEDRSLDLLEELLARNAPLFITDDRPLEGWAGGVTPQTKEAA